jgi:hypothetical protein
MQGVTDADVFRHALRPRPKRRRNFAVPYHDERERTTGPYEMGAKSLSSRSVAVSESWIGRIRLGNVVCGVQNYGEA